MTETGSDGWEEVFRGPCLQANLVHAVLEANGLQPVTRELSSQTWWSGSVLEDCRVYVPSGQLEDAKRALEEQESDA